MKEIDADVGGAGEVVLPNEVRERLGLDEPGRVRFVITDEGVRLYPAHGQSAATRHATVDSPERPLTWERIEEIAREDREDRLARKLGITPRT
ncbi:MAG: AbrB/MazE/SpoVT family DNA-binding domain-containing protein [Chloroflexota bacterium]|nr:AbrB/MazE/SpoVT family DNA-binding domain-containing protein [Chloroflexota bacterium]